MFFHKDGNRAWLFDTKILAQKSVFSSVSHRENKKKNYFCTRIAPVNDIYILLQKSSWWIISHELKTSHLILQPVNFNQAKNWTNYKMVNIAVLNNFKIFEKSKNYNIVSWFA